MYKVPKEKALILVKVPPTPPTWKTTFVSSHAESHQGRENISDIFNASRFFLPLLGERDVVDLVRRDAIRWVRVEKPDYFEWYYYEIREGAARSTVRCTFTDGEVLEGEFCAMGPVGEQRVQDIVNRPLDFVHLEAAVGLFLVNLKHVIKITVIKEEDGGP